MFKHYSSFLKNSIKYSNISKNSRYFQTDEQIARKMMNHIKPIDKLIQKKYNINEKHIDLYGKYKAKLNISYCNTLKNHKDGKLILVSAMTPTKYGEGKTCTTIGLTDSVCNLGKKAIAAIREPSMGPVFGMKGGATGGGYSQVIPMDDINLHFTGDIHAITSAHNLISSLIDNHLYWGNKLNIDVESICWPRVIDMNDRTLRNIIINDNKVFRKEHFIISVASEIMAVFCLSENLNQLNKRIGNIIIGYNKHKNPVKVKHLNGHNAATALLKTAFSPNIVQTLENNIVFVHGGPFANIAHGCNSIVATKTALKLADYVFTEAGFGTDLGAEKFLNIKCRAHNLNPAAVVVVATCRALKNHGENSLGKNHPSEDLLDSGFLNLLKHVHNISKFNIPSMVVLNKFHEDNINDITYIKKLCIKHNVHMVVSEHHKKGSKGSIELGKSIIKLTEDSTNKLEYLYDLDSSIKEKINTITTEIYNVNKVIFSKKVLKKIHKIEDMGYSKLPICIAKNQYSFSGDNLKQENKLIINDVKLSAGAEFIVIHVGDIMTMPGLPQIPSAVNIGVDENNNVYGLF